MSKRERLIVEPEFAALFARAGLRRFDDVANLPADRVDRDLPRRRTFRVLIDDTPAWVKLSRGPDREFDRLRRLHGLGLPVPMPMARGESGGRTLVVLSELTGARQADFYLEEQYKSLPPQQWLTVKRAAIRRIAEVARQFHGRRFHHRDFYLCHFWLRPIEGDDFEVFLLDHHRTGFHPLLWRRWLVKDLAQLHFSCAPRLFSRTDRMRFLRVYLGKSKLDHPDKQLIAAVRGKAKRIAAHLPKHDRPHTEHGEMTPRSAGA